MTVPVLIATGVERHFGEGSTLVIPVAGVDLELLPGEIVLLTGPSGSGKSTLLHLLTGFDRCDRGTVRWAGVDDGQEPAWSVLGIVPQSLGLVAELTVAENIEIALVLDGVPEDEARARAEEAMNRLAIGHLSERFPGETSLGQQQRVAIARASASQPTILIADEPTSHQDEDNADLVMAELRRCADQGSACLIAGHDPRLTAVADRRLALLDGRFSDEASQPMP